jgi:hypothetical protein
MRRIPNVYLIAGGAVAVALLWAMSRGAQQTGQAIGGAAVDLVNGVVGGAVVGVGQIAGIPATNRTQCEIDKANGDTWRASFSCPAGEFLRYVWD